MNRPYWLIATRRWNQRHVILWTFWTVEQAQQSVENVLARPGDLQGLTLTEYRSDRQPRVLVDWRPT